MYQRAESRMADPYLNRFRSNSGFQSFNFQEPCITIYVLSRNERGAV